jgi:Tol biopolymer transport system component/DNA-binding winged helix-turn-helix (wHTH) protein
MDLTGCVVRVGLFEIDIDAGELRKNGVRIKLQDQPFLILRLLVESRGEIVSRDVLRARLWPDGTFVDFDHSLNASINKLRDAFGDCASDARFIQTSPRRGYRFVAPAEVVRPSAVEAPAIPVTVAVRAAEGAGAKRWPRLATAGAASTLLLTAIAAIASWSAVQGRHDIGAEVLPLTSAPGVEVQPSFSPDGSHIAYLGQAPGFEVFSVHVRQVGTESFRVLTAGPDMTPQWSPDGRSIAFVRFLAREGVRPGVVNIIPAMGGPERAVPGGQVRTRAQFVLLSWLPDSERLVIADHGTSSTASLFVLNTRTGARTRLTEPPAGGIGDYDPAVSLNGRRLVFTRYKGNEISPELFLLELTSEGLAAGVPRLLATGIGSQKASWMPDGKGIVFAGGPQHRKRLMAMGVEPPSPPRLLPFAAEGTLSMSAAISRRNQLVYPVFKGGIQIHRTELGPDGGAVRTQKLLPTLLVDHLPAYSPDGSQIAFVSNRSGAQEIWLAKADGSGPVQLTSLRGKPEATWPRWSPDGRRIVFTGDSAAYVVSAEGGTPELVASESSGTLICDWSRDGRWLYMQSARSGRAEIWKVPLPGTAEPSEAKQITKNGGEVPWLSQDGKFVYFAKGNWFAELWRVSAEGGTAERIVARLATSGSFAITAGGIYYVPASPAKGDPCYLVFRDGLTGRERVIAPVQGTPMWGMTVSPDARSLLYVSSERQESDLMMVESFR